MISVDWCSAVGSQQCAGPQAPWLSVIFHITQQTCSNLVSPRITSWHNRILDTSEMDLCKVSTIVLCRIVLQNQLPVSTITPITIILSLPAIQHPYVPLLTIQRKQQAVLGMFERSSIDMRQVNRYRMIVLIRWECTVLRSYLSTYGMSREWMNAKQISLVKRGDFKGNLTKALSPIRSVRQWMLSSIQKYSRPVSNSHRK